MVEALEAIEVIEVIEVITEILLFLMLGGPFILTGLLFWLSFWWKHRPVRA